MKVQLKLDGCITTVKGILFDKDGTLLNFVSLWGIWGELLVLHVNQIVRRKSLTHDLPKPSESLSVILGVTCDERGGIVDYDTEGLLSTGSAADIRNAVVQYCIKAGFNSAEAETIAEESMSEASKGIDELRPVQARARVVEVLKHLSEKGIRIAVVTADETEDAIKHLEWLGISHYFQTIIGHDQVPNGKPNPDMVFLACERMGLSPSDVAVIGDTEGDMRMGKAAGAALTVAILPEGKAVPIGDDKNHYGSADVLISSYEQLLHGLNQSTPNESEEMFS
ncbi:HAD family hydrolase [Paenibacillus sp. NPDC058071]|uniref:HAD family hydrolase n=1 Tax=Paenibacillus sp. NPDC058071 TaxID=3346326 RepID=UPI0036DEE3AE